MSKSPGEIDAASQSSDVGGTSAVTNIQSREQEEKNNWLPFPFARRTNRPWREQAMTRAAELRTLLEFFRTNENGSGSTNGSQLAKAIEGHLQEATKAAGGLSWWRPARNLATMERVTSNLDAAEVGLLRWAPNKYIRGQISHILAHVRFHLPKNDPRRTQVEELSKTVVHDGLDEYGKEAVIQAVWVASLEARREVARVQSFCGVLYATAFFLTIAAASFVAWGLNEPTHVPLCFQPGEVDVCPIGTGPNPFDILLIEFIGLLSGAVTGATGLRHMSGRTTRLGLPVALAVLKLPMGALTAILGILLMRGNFIPGLSNLDTSAQIIAWAVVFGAAQQLVTGFVDRKANDVLSQVASKTNKET